MRHGKIRFFLRRNTFFLGRRLCAIFFFLKRRVVLSGADEPDSSEPAKGLKEGVFQM